MNRIDGPNPLATSRTTQGQAAQSIDGGGADRDGGAEQVAGPQDNVTLSPQARTVAQVAGYVNGSPDTRAAKVAALRALIANGSYSVDAGDIARRLLATGTFGAD